MELEGLTHRIIGCAMRVHRALGPGFLEAVYARALAWELRLASLPVETDHRIAVRYRSRLVGDFVADLLIDGRLIVELKAVQRLAPVHEAQLVNYLAATRMPIGLLLNFGNDRLVVRRKWRGFVEADAREEIPAHADVTATADRRRSDEV